MLEPHPLEGGYFRRTYQSESEIIQSHVSRRLMSSIYYMLTGDNPIGYMHRNKSDILHFYHSGSPIKYIIVSNDGVLYEQILGPDVLKGQLPQLLVKGGDWKAAELTGGEYGLLSEAVSPGFEYADNEIARPEWLKSLPVEIQTGIKKYIKS